MNSRDSDALKALLIQAGHVIVESSAEFGLDCSAAGITAGAEAYL